MGVRFRSTVAAVLVVAVGLVAGAVALVALLRAELTHDVRQASRARAVQVAEVIESGRGVPSLAVAEQDEQFIQVLDEAGAVVAGSTNVEELPALARPQPGGEATVHTPLDEDEFLVVAVAADAPDGRKTVLVGRALIAVAEASDIVTRLLAVGLPLLLLLAGGATWMAVGRALAPVAAVRTEVEAISSAELHRRVPLPRGRDEIARLAATMNRMLERLERSQDAQRRFVSDASHELRSPVASIRQHAEVALAHPERTTPAELAETVLAEDLRIQRLVDDLLLLARADEDALRPQLRPVDVDDLVLAEARRLRARARRDGAVPDAGPGDRGDGSTPGPRLQVDATRVSAARMDADTQWLCRVLRNLGDNAARHARSRVAFDVVQDDHGRIVLGVEDDGSGVPPAERDRVFERFVRLDDARTRVSGGGSGLGLAIVAELVAAHGGSVTVTEGALGGARFEIVFPATSGAESGS